MHTSASPSGESSYRVFGLTVRSVLRLPGLVPCFAEATPDVDIKLGAVPAIAGASAGYHLVDDGTLLTIPGVARFWIEGGRLIVVAPADDASQRNIRLFLLGSALGAILHQRGLVPLHANAVEIGGRAVAFMGHSGAGKSTLAAWFLDRGRGVLTDDVCVVDQQSPGGPLAHRGLVRLRLWREAMERSGREIQEAARSFDNQDKFDVIMPDERHTPETLPLGAAVLLERAEDGGPSSIERMRGMAAVAALFENVYRGGYAEQSGSAGALLKACVGIASSVPVLRVKRRWGFSSFDEEAAGVEVAVAKAMAPSSEIIE